MVQFGDAIMRKWKMAGATIQGIGHIKSGTPCQDAIYLHSAGDINTISLADGAGSRALSQIGASLATRSIGALIAQRFDELYSSEPQDTVEIIVQFLQNRLMKKAEHKKMDIKNLSSTFLFVSIHNDNRYIAGHIGDGVIGSVFDNRIDVLSHPDNGEFHNETFFLTLSNAKDKFRVYKGTVPDDCGFIIMSDGTAESLYSRNDENLTATSNKIIKWLDGHTSKDVNKALKRHLKKLFRKKTIDDCSIAIIRSVEKNINEINELDDAQKKEFMNVKNKRVAETRIRILTAISQRPGITINEIVMVTGVSKPTVKKHLLELRKSLLIRSKVHQREWYMYD